MNLTNQHKPKWTNEGKKNYCFLKTHIFKVLVDTTLKIISSKEKLFKV